MRLGGVMEAEISGLVRLGNRTKLQVSRMIYTE